jgi:hypothetical protein
MTLRSDRMTVRLIVAMVTAGTLIASRGALAQQPPDGPVKAVETATPAQIVLPDGASLNASFDAMRAAIRRVTKSQSLLVSTADASGATSGAAELKGTAADGAPADAVLSGSIVGTVQDPSGATVTGVDLTIRNLATDEVLIRTSDASGGFSVQNLTPGSYEIKAEKAGFREADATIVVGASQRLHADFRLKLATTAESSVASAGTNAPDLEALETRIEMLETELAALKASAGAPQGAQPSDAQTPAAPAVDNQTPFAFGDFTWVNGGPRNKKVALDTPFFTPEVRFDTHYLQDFNNPIDHSIGGSTENFRSGEVQIEQASVGGDFHMDNVRGRILFMQGLFATTTPRNDASAGVGQWDVRGAYKYVSEAYGGYHIDVQHGLNIDAGIFVSYIGLFSYYNFDNWTYQPSYVSSNTPWFFNGLRVQWFPTNKLKIEPWFINGWQSYNKFNGRPGLGGQILYTPTENVKLVFNNYANGTDALGVPNRKRFHTDDSFLLRYYHHPENTGISQMAMSFTADFGCEYGGGVKCTGGNADTPSQYFAGWMVYDHIWLHKDLFAITPGGGVMSNPGRYLTLLPPINGADAISGSPYFPESPGLPAKMWDATLNLQYYPREFLTFWWEAGYRHSNVPYFTGRGGITPPGGNNGSPANYVCSTGATAGTSDLTAAELACGGGASSVWFPDLRKTQTILSMGILVKF